MFDLEKFRTGEYYVHLPTLELYKEVMKFLENNDFLWIDGDNPTNDNVYLKYMSETCISYKKDSYPQGLVYSGLDYWKEKVYKQLEINKVVKRDDNMNEKMKRDLIKLLFEKEFSSYDLENMYEYKGRVITDYVHRTARFIDFIDKIKGEYGIGGHEVADIIIKEFDLKVYSED